GMLCDIVTACGRAVSAVPGRVSERCRGCLRFGKAVLRAALPVPAGALGSGPRLVCRGQGGRFSAHLPARLPDNREESVNF
ncbi:MAG: hypothetical protein ACI4MR_04435, partial [Candidatus Aphodomorpha sp.]